MTQLLIQNPIQMQWQIAGASLDLIVLDYCDVTIWFWGGSMLRRVFQTPSGVLKELSCADMNMQPEGFDRTLWIVGIFFYH